MHLYIHVPFCDGKCAYCGFYSVSYTENSAAAYLSVLEREMQMEWGSDKPGMSSVYIGGGTPSALGSKHLERLVELVQSRCRLLDGCEWTLEGSPNTLSPDKVDLLVEAGVNRISVGIQTFDDVVLKAMERRHTAKDARSVIEYLVGRGDIEVGCDLIAGLPGHSDAKWREDLRAIAGLGLRHASVYALSLEEGTPLARKYGEGGLQVPDSDEVADRLLECGEVFAKSGLARYEVSNYAEPGRECRHNLGYWQGEDFVGMGPGASSRMGLLRRTNKPDIKGYLQAPAIPRDEELLSDDEDVQERLMYFFRLQEGVDLDAYCAAHNVDDALLADWKERLKYLCEEGIVSRHGSRYAPTARGLDFADAICEVFLS